MTSKLEKDIAMNRKLFTSLAAIAACGLLVAPIQAMAGADSGFYLGGSIGSGTLNADVPDNGTTYEFDANASAWKVFGGYNFGLVPLVDLAIEGSYVDFGDASDTVASLIPIDVSLTGMNLYGLVGLNFGPFGIFAKAGFVDWDGDVTVDGVGQLSDNGTDGAYGIGARLQFGSFQLRGEAEMYDISDFNDIYMLSLGFSYTF